jgi:hypothetical protein
MPSSGIIRHVAPVRAEDSEEHSASIIRMTRIGELATDARCEEILCQFLQEPDGVTSQMTEIFIVTAVKT